MELKSLFVRTPLPPPGAPASAGKEAGADPRLPQSPDGLRWRPIMEMAAIFGILSGIDHLVGTGGAFANVDPHPFWAPVLLMAVTYGSGMGLAAALAATAIWVADHGALGAGDHLQRMLALSIMPMLWVTSALVIGEISSSRLIRVARLAHQRVKLKRDQHKLVDMIRQLIRTNRALQVRIAVEERAVEDAVAAALELGEASADQRIAGIERLVALVTGSAAFAFYRVIDGDLVPVLRGAGAHGGLTMEDLVGYAAGRIDEDTVVRIGQDCHVVAVCSGGDPVLDGVLAVEGAARGPLGESLQVALVQIARSLEGLVPRPLAQDAPLLLNGHPRALVQDHAA
ncbi:MAG: hypothetical protein RIS94_944 [Pseudomonadota bacterium]|jgi:hypothetical protein